MEDNAAGQARNLPRPDGEQQPAAPDRAPDPISNAHAERLESLYRCLAVQQALLDERLLRLERNRLFLIWNALTRKTAGWIAHLPAPLTRRLTGGGDSEQAAAQAYSVWVAHEEADWPAPELARAEAAKWPYQPTVSIAMVATAHGLLAEALKSVETQAYPAWELCVAFDSGSSREVLPLLAETGARTGRVRYVSCDDASKAARWNAAAGLATGDYIAFSGDRDVWSPLALFYLVQILQGSDADLVYSDEDELDSTGRRVRPLFKPDWSPELLSRTMYIGRPLMVRTGRFGHCGGFRTDAGGDPFHDLAQRVTTAPASVRHVSKVLYHSRTPARGAAADVPAGPVPEAAGAATAIVCSKSPDLLATCLRSLRATAAETIRDIVVVAHEESGPNHALRRVAEENGATVVPFSGVFNFSLMNNLGAARAETPYLIFLNDDVRAAAPSWAARMVEQLARRGAGIAGATLWYPSGVLQHAGIVSGLADGVGHAGRHMRSSRLWPWLLTTREVSAVTGACLGMRSDLFRQLGGFDPGFPNNYNDVDLCFRARRAGGRVVCCAVPGLVHAECQTRPGVVRFEERYRFFMTWGHVLASPDPYYSAALAPTETIALKTGGGLGSCALLGAQPRQMS